MSQKMMAIQRDHSNRQFLQRSEVRSPRNTKARAKAIPKVLNLYEPDPAPETFNASKPPHLYDINSAMPFRILETDHVRLEPFVPAKHLQGFLSFPKESWDVLADLGPYDNKTALEDLEAFRQDPNCLVLAAIDKQAEEAALDSFAGVYGLTEYDEEAINVLFGFINVHPRYHKTHVNSHAMYLILSFLFDDLHLIRVQYDAVTFNEASIKAGLRFGFKAEGICRNLHGLVPQGKRRKGEGHKSSQDLWLSSMTDYEWETEGRARLKEMIERPVVNTAWQRY